MNTPKRIVDELRHKRDMVADQLYNWVMRSN